MPNVYGLTIIREAGEDGYVAPPTLNEPFPWPMIPPNLEILGIKAEAPKKADLKKPDV